MGGKLGNIIRIFLFIQTCRVMVKEESYIRNFAGTLQLHD